MIHLDTNILVAATMDDQEILGKLLRLSQSRVGLAASTVAWAEFCNGPLSETDRRRVEALIGENFLPFSKEHALISADLFNVGGRRRGSGQDCMIAAAAIAREEPLLTRNARDFSRFESQGLQLEPLN